MHYLNAQNEYLKAIKSVGDILQYYDSDNQIPAFGFGAQINGQVEHCFALNGDIFHPECNGIEGVIDAYQHAIRNVKLYGPTNFSEILNLIVTYTESLKVSQDNQKYNILLIITDGIISDMPQTIDEIVRGSSMALSIIIVGVGSANFDAMNVLDADDRPLYSKKYMRQMAADIV